MTTLKNHTPAYAELHAASAFSFLRGASLPEDLAAEAARRGLRAMALVDANGIYGAPRFFRAAKEHGLKALVGAEVSLDVNTGALAGLFFGPGEPPRVTLLAASRTGYRNLCRLLTAAAAGRAKGQALAHWDSLALHADGLHALTGGTEGPLARLLSGGTATPPMEAADRCLDRLGVLFPGRLHVELQRHRTRDAEHRLHALTRLARARRLPLLATNGVRYARSREKDLLDVLTCIRRGVTLDTAGKVLAENREARVKSPAEMAALFADLPEALRNAVALADELHFTLDDLGYRFPAPPLAPGDTAAARLRRLTWEGARERFHPLNARTRAQLEKELTVIETLGLAGYFLIVWDIVRFCRAEGILAQGRGSAANSAVCYALSITAVDPVKMDLLFERFLSEERGEWPDIDLDLPSGPRRERVVQYVYATYGAHSAAMTANVITYQPRSAIREAAKAFGFTQEETGKLAAHLGRLDAEEARENPDSLAHALAAAGLDPRHPRAQRLLRVWMGLLDLPRHMGQHPGGMVVAGGRLDDVVPLEPAAMANRAVIQWDKEDCAALGIVKIDLLGLGMLAALEEAVPMIARHEGVTIDLSRLPPDDPAVYRMLNAADTVGLFQLESRAQMASLPRNAPKTFYDIVVQVAIIRPGPIGGGMIRPFFDRRQGKAPVAYPHPSLEPILKRTLGVPLFQEQILKIAMTAANFTGGEAEELRRAMGFRRSTARMREIEHRLMSGMEANGIPRPAREEIRRMVGAFALYGFPESHAASFALIAYASAYLKVHHPAAFYASLLNAWPMGFYHPATLIKDAQRRGVDVRGVDVNRSGWKCRWEDGNGRPAFRLGFRFVHGLGEADAVRIETEQAHAPFNDAGDLARRAGLQNHHITRLAHAGALGAFGLTRRDALWQAAELARPNGPLFAAVPLDTAPAPLPRMSAAEETAADYTATGVTTGPHAIAHLRPRLTKQGVTPAAALTRLAGETRVTIAGAVIVRQKPPTAKGFVFITLEDETGMAQAIIRPDLFHTHRALITGAGALVVEGVLQNEPGVPSLRATRLWPLGGDIKMKSHDFQ